MNAWTPPPSDALPDDAPPCGGGDESALVERQLWALGRLADAGLDIVEAIRRQAIQGAASDAPPPNSPMFHGDLALAYARASRAVRMSIALQSRLMNERREQAVEAATQARMSAVRDRPARRARIDRIVGRLAQDSYEDDEEEVERCVAEAAERLNDVDVFGDVLDRPVSETIALICRELDLEPDWAALAEDAWARQEIESGAVGEPLAELAEAKRSKHRPGATSPIPPSPSPQGLADAALRVSLGSSPPPHVRDG